jgi:hypothetical protein
MPRPALAEPKPPAYPWSSAEYCTFLKAMDVYHGTDPRSPLHHDQRCTLMVKD